MTEGNESTLRFTLEESVWFKKGQEVSELISISLDPDITIHEEDQYVIIKGFLQLTGEYKRHGDLDSDEELPASPKFVQMVEHRHGDVFEFIHRFPVDIMIPVNRIKNTEDIEVVIESFDYHLPERSCLKLVADLTISGLSNEEENNLPDEHGSGIQHAVIRPLHFDNSAQRPLEETQRESPQEHRPSTEENAGEDLFAPFSAAARKQLEPEQEKILPLAPEWTAVRSETERTDSRDRKENPEMEAVNLQNRGERREEPEPVADRPEGSSLSAAGEGESFRLAEREKSAGNVSEAGEPDEESSSFQPDLAFKEKKKKEKKDGISLAEFFARKEEADEVARSKVCIVQQGDTIETIAERYDVSVQSILKINDMDMNQDVQTGQVLYIPEPAVNKS